MDENLKREIIMEHYQNPLNRHVIEDESYFKVNTNNASCIDNLDLYIKIEKGVLIFGYILELIYIIYQYTLGGFNVYQYVMYLIFFILLLCLTNISLKIKI